MGDLEWSNELVVRLITEYKDRPQLWDTTHPMYRVNTLKYESWRELAAMFEVDIADMRKKLNSVFASHRREKARVRAGIRSNWFLYPHMSFLPTHEDDSFLQELVTPDKKKHSKEVRILNDTRITADASSEDHNYGTDQDEDIDEVVRKEIIIKQEPKVNHRALVRPVQRLIRNESYHKQRIKKPIKKRTVIKETTEASQQSDGMLAEVLKLLRRSDHGKKKDSCDSFGEYIADSLKKHDEKTQAMIKQAINNIIFEQEMKKYNSSRNEYTVVIAGMDENPLVSDSSDK